MAESRSGRDPRLDVFRGLALVMIFINHAPRNYLESFTNRNFGFSDAAEAFVFMSGIAAGIAYSGSFRRGDPFDGVTRVLRRVWTLYQVHILITVVAIAIAAAAAHWFAAPDMMRKHGIWTLVTDPLGFLIGVPLLGQQIGYVNILPLYLVLLLLVPPVIWAAMRWPLVVLSVSVTIWLTAGVLRINFPNYPQDGGWFLNPFSWQLLFVVGVLTGVAHKAGRRFVPVLPWLQWLTGGFLLLSLVWMQWPDFAAVMRGGLKLAQDAGVPWVITGFNKTYLAAPRLLHILALAYFLSSFVTVRRICFSAFAAPFALLGQQALPVFALGTVLAFAIQSAKTVTGQDFVLDTLMIGGGLLAQLGLAAAKQYWPKPRQANGRI
ncbi:MULTISPECIES: OpgC domain-containing protein [unclassified Yoonia]|uniref:OpgC family protein n=1 Tax=unclassified Yoonia TaxID=2629118 RepID=UPI002B001DEF|nr:MULTISPECIES: OpgC domain-containing protein [unclassified Yoonia]